MPMLMKLLSENGRAKGVALKDGTEYRADIVVSNLDPKRTFLDITNPKDLPEDVLKKARNFKIRGSSGKLNIALDGLPTFNGIDPRSRMMGGEMHFSDTMARQERAYDDWKKRYLVQRSLSGHAHSVNDRSHYGPSRQAYDVGICAVCAAKD